MPQKDENKYEERGYKISNTATYARLNIATTVLNANFVTAATHIGVSSTGINMPVSFTGLNFSANLRGTSIESNITILSLQDRRVSRQYLFNNIVDNLIYNNITDNIVENIYQTTYRKNITKIRSVSSTYQEAPEKLPTPSFHKFERAPSLSKHVEVNVCQASMFSFDKPLGLEFHYKEMANNESWIQGYGAEKMTKGEYLSVKKELSDIYTDNLVKHIENFESKGEGDVIEPNKIDGVLKPHFPGSWKNERGETHWVNFPTEEELRDSFGQEKADLLINSGEYDYNKKFIEALGESNTCIVDQVNQAIPDVNNPIQMATPLAANPKDLAYNKKYGGLVSIQINRGKQQRYIFSQATGRTWIIGSNHLYFSGPRRVVHLDEHAELAETYKLMVKSSANYHFACRNNLEKNTFKDGVRKGKASSVNYRYEGDFNIETVSVGPREPGETAGILNEYKSGIHSTKDGKISIRADVVRLSSVGVRIYKDVHSPEADRSFIELNKDGLTATGEEISLTATNRFSTTVGGKEKMIIDHREVTIAKGTQFKASGVLLQGKTRCIGKVDFL